MRTRSRQDEDSRQQSNDSLEVYMDRCKSQLASIDSLNHKSNHLESSLEAAPNTLEGEKEQSAIRQTSLEELRATAKHLDALMHFASDGLQDEKSCCNMYQASITSLTANVRGLEQSLHLVNMDLDKHKRRYQDFLVSTEGNVLSAKVLSRIAKLSKSHSVQQVVLHMNLRQLDAMVEKLDWYSKLPLPVVKSGFAITEGHINRFSMFSFGKARMKKLVNYQLYRASTGLELDAKTRGFKPSGLFTLIPRVEAIMDRLTLRGLHDSQ